MATTTNYSWTTPDNTAYVKDGASAIRTLGSSVDTTLFTALGGTYPGLRLVKKQTIGSGVSSVTVTGAFSATYENYKIIVSGGTATATGSITLGLTGITTGYYQAGTFVNYSSTTVNGFTNNNGSTFSEVGQASSANILVNCELHNPFATKTTSCFATWGSNTTASYSIQLNGFNTSTTSISGFTLNSTTGTWTGGTIYVYGYGAS